MTKDLKALARLFDVANTHDEVIDGLARLLDILKRAHRVKATQKDHSAGREAL